MIANVNKDSEVGSLTKHTYAHMLIEFWMKNLPNHWNICQWKSYSRRILIFFPYFYLPIFLFSMAWTSGKLIEDEALCHWRYVYMAIKIVNINPFFRHLSFFPLGVFRVHFPHAVWITSYDYSHFSSLKMLQEK